VDEFGAVVVGVVVFEGEEEEDVVGQLLLQRHHAGLEGEVAELELPVGNEPLYVGQDPALLLPPQEEVFN
jgi:hypothetical protein